MIDNLGKILKETELLLRVIVSPNRWILNDSVDKKWDKEMRRCYHEEELTGLCSHDATFGPHNVWISNHPYASFQSYRGSYPSHRSPSRRTMILLGKKLKKAKKEKYG